jgi:hypothetical protein
MRFQDPEGKRGVTLRRLKILITKVEMEVEA